MARGLSSCGSQALEGLVAPQHVGSSRIRAQTCVPCIGRRILNHCATREVPLSNFSYADVQREDFIWVRSKTASHTSKDRLQWPHKSEPQPLAGRPLHEGAPLSQAHWLGQGTLVRKSTPPSSLPCHHNLSKFYQTFKSQSSHTSSRKSSQNCPWLSLLL